MIIVTETWWWNVYVFGIEWTEIYTPKNKDKEKLSYIITHPLDLQNMTLTTLNRIYKNDK